MKKLLVIVALLVSVVSFSKAQGYGQQGTPEEQAQRSLDRPSVVALNLTADQKTKAMPILVAYNKAVADLRAKAMAGGGDMQAAMTEIRPKMTTLADENEKLLVAMLTADQKKAYDAALATAKQNNPNATTVIIGGGRGGQRPPGQ
jgi:hypothetical protein